MCSDSETQARKVTNVVQDKLVLGIDLGGTDCKYGIVDSQGNVVRKAKFPTEVERGPEGVIELMARHAREVIGSDDVKSVGLGVPGPMSSREGIVYETPNLGWNNVPAKRILEGHLGLPVAMNNDANAAAYGEFWAGAGRSVNTMILFTLGTGVGGGIILDGKLYVGPDDTAGELGHIVINYQDGPICGCGNRGCLEAYASATAVKRMVREGLAKGVKTIIQLPKSDEEFGAKLVYDAAVQGDAFAIDIFKQVGVALGVGAASIINIFNPDMIAYSGAMAGAGDFIFTPLVEAAKSFAFEKPFSRVQIVQAKLGSDAGIIGAAGLALHA